MDNGPDDEDEDVDYLEAFDEHGNLKAFDEDEPLIIQPSSVQEAAMHSENPQSQDTQQIAQPSGIQEARSQTVQPVLTQQGVIDLVSKDAVTFTPGSGWRQRKHGYCDMLKGYESPNGNTVSVAVDLAALVIMSGVSETSIRNNSLKMQQAAN